MEAPLCAYPDFASADADAAYYDCQYPLKGYQCKCYAYHHALFRIAGAVADVVRNQAGQSDGTKDGRIERTVSIKARSEEHDDKPACALCYDLVPTALKPTRSAA